MKVLSRLENGGWKCRVVGRVGKMLRLETEGGAMTVHLAFLATHGPIEKVAAIELDARFSCVHFHYPAAGRLINLRSE